MGSRELSPIFFQIFTSRLGLPRPLSCAPAVSQSLGNSLSSAKESGLPKSVPSQACLVEALARFSRRSSRLSLVSLALQCKKMVHQIVVKQTCYRFP